jgi:hypothetical protein
MVPINGMSILLVSALAGATPVTAQAQEPAAQIKNPATANDAPSTSPEAEGPANNDEEAEIVVEGQSPAQRGAVAGDIAPEVQISRSTIRSMGLGSVSDVLDELAPQIHSHRGRGEAPVILVNGHRTSGFSEVRDIPAEAISRIDILPEEVALKYGFAAKEHVVNIVLRKHFRAFVAEARDWQSTEGGRNSIEPSLSFTRISEKSRVNLSARYLRADRLQEDGRDIAIPVPGKPYALDGNVTAVAGSLSSELDPMLSQLVGRPVTIAAVPGVAASAAPHLSDFVSTANRPAQNDTRRYRSLLPSADELALNAVASQTIFHGVEATLNARLQLDRSDTLSGLPGYSVILPAGNPFSPFANDVGLYRYSSPSEPTRRHTNDLAGHVGLNLNGSLRTWNWSLTGNYDHTESRERIASGVDASALQAALLADDPRVNPFAAISAPLVHPRMADRTHANADHGVLDIIARGNLLPLPAGRMSLATRLGADWEALDSLSARSGNTTASLSRRDVNGQISLDIPIASRRRDVLPFLGALSINANVAVHHLSDIGTLRTYGFGLAWSPNPALRILASMTDEDTPPTLLQLGAPGTVTTGVRAYDFVNGETADVSLVESGNSQLKNENRSVFRLGVTARPTAVHGLSMTASFIHRRIRDAIVSQLISDSIMISAFPDRFVRNPSRTLVRIVHSPVNLDRVVQDELRWGINFAKGPTARGPLLNGTAPPQTASPTFQFAIYHTWHIRDEAQVRQGLPTVDLLDGGAIDAKGGQSPHEIEAQAGVAKGAFGLRTSVDWRSSTKIVGSTPGGSLHFSDLPTMNLHFFINFGQQKTGLVQYPWLQGMRLTMSIDNIFDSIPHVIDGTGQTPASYQRDLLDPLGRTVRLSLRKVFY